MVMLMLLLASAVAQLVVSAPSTADPGRLNLNHIIDEVHKLNKTLANEFFVEDVQPLVDAGCKDDFFCKVHDILKKHVKAEETKKVEEILLRHLAAYTSHKNIDCPEVLKKVKESSVTKPITDMLENIEKCSKRRNFGSK